MMPPSFSNDGNKTGSGPGRGVPGYHHVVKSVATALRRRCGVRAGDRVILAVSGGCDSVAMARAMAILAVSRKWRLKPVIGHVQHHLRGEESEDDARFAESLAVELELPFIRTDIDVVGEVACGGGSAAGNLESCARRLRYRALNEMAVSCNAAFVATGHHADDQLETLLMRLIRGASVSGLRGIAWRRRPASYRRVTLIRPMLGLTREELIDFLSGLDQRWREDRMNADMRFLRSRLRHEVLPLLRGLRPDVAVRSVDLSDHFRQLHQLLKSEAGRYHERVGRTATGGYIIDRGESRLMPKPVLIMLLRRLCSELGARKDRLGLNALKPVVRAIRDTRGGERTFDLSTGLVIIVRRGEVVVGVKG